MDAHCGKEGASEEVSENVAEASKKCPTYEEALRLLDTALEAKREMRRRLHLMRERLGCLERAVG